jgi:hypothetical protein
MAHMKFVADRPLADPETGAQRLAEIVDELVCPQGFSYTGATNTAFLRAGGTVDDYRAARNLAIARGWIEIDRSGTRIKLLVPIADVLGDNIKD